MKLYSTFLKVPGLDSHHQSFSVVSRTLVRGEGLTPLQRCKMVHLQNSSAGLFNFSDGDAERLLILHQSTLIS